MKSLIVVILCCLLAVPSYGAFGAATQWYVDGAAGADTNGGGFDSGVASPGTDESGTATAITITTASTTTGTGSPAFSSTTHGPGNFVHVASGTGCTVGWYEITSQAAGTATFDHAIAAAGGDTCVGTIGGNMATIAATNANTVAGNTVNVKDSATYNVGSSLTQPAAGVAGSPTVMRGYHSTPGDAGNCTISPTGTGCPVLQATAGSFSMLTFGGINKQIQNFVFDCNSQAASTGLTLNSSSGKAFNLTIKSCGTAGLVISTSGGSSATNVWIHGGLAACTAGVNVTNTSAVSLVAVVSESNPCPGFLVGNGASAITCVYCVAANNSGAASDGFGISTANTGGTGIMFVNSAAYKNGRDGWRFTSTNGIVEATVRFSWSYGNTGNSLNSSGGALTGTQQFNWNAYESGSLNNILAGHNDITLSADPTTNGASGDFSLNSAAGGGAALKAEAFPGVLGSSTGFMSIGPIQPAINSGSSGGGFFGSIQ